MREIVNQQVEKVKTHIQENQKFYIGVGVGISVAVIVTIILKKNSGSAIYQGVALNVKSPLVANTLNVTIPKAGNSGNIIQCDQTGVVYPSQNVAARALGISPGNLSKHLTGHEARTFGYTFTKLVDGGE